MGDQPLAPVRQTSASAMKTTVVASGSARAAHVQVFGQGPGHVVPGHELHPARASAAASAGSPPPPPPPWRWSRPGSISNAMPAARRATISSSSRPKIAGSPGLQPHHPRPGRGIVDQQPADMVLLRRGAPGAFADGHKVRAGPRKIEDRPDERSSNSTASADFRRFTALTVNSSGSPGPEPDERDEARSCPLRDQVEERARNAAAPAIPVSGTAAPSASTTRASGASGCSRMVE